MLDLLDEESRFPKGTDSSLLEKLHGAHKVRGEGEREMKCRGLNGGSWLEEKNGHSCFYVCAWYSLYMQDNAFYVKPKVNNAKFGIRHYAGEVFYLVTGLLEKNRDTFRDDMLKVMKESR